MASLYGSDAKALADAAIELAPLHGRVHVISPDVAALHTGHGNVMPHRCTAALAAARSWRFARAGTSTTAARRPGNTTVLDPPADA